MWKYLLGIAAWFADWFEQWSLTFVTNYHCTRCLAPKNLMGLPCFSNSYKPRSAQHAIECAANGTLSTFGYKDYGLPSLLEIDRLGYGLSNPYGIMMIESLHHIEIPHSVLGDGFKWLYEYVNYNFPRDYANDILKDVDILFGKLPKFGTLKIMKHGSGLSAKITISYDVNGIKKPGDIVFHWTGIHVHLCSFF